MHFTPHKVNGKFYGGWYELASGRTVYLAHRTAGEVYRRKMAWCLDNRTLREAQARGVDVVGVVVRSGKKLPHVYLAWLADFYGPASFIHFGDTPQRGLPMGCFRVHPGNTAASIISAAALR
ncbi:hypothetical protein [Cupriavidus campinensis]|uniref:Uncharacterized protein n=1 Tax=Cupriavidus campinensis TaxID=151783 RepID=A0ABY3EST3_9BURK|nr:hypothetical protein [Cupriavidus campinensis]TSP14002.1 hypothetical protein FGG12_05895 [Cupriavidus campinensis]